MSEYFLFLDELKPNKDYSHFCLGGCFIEDSYYRQTIVPKVNELKNKFWGNQNIVLHESEIRSRHGKFKKLKDSSVDECFWNSLRDIFEKCDLHTLCVGVDCEKFKETYPTKGNMDNSEYYVALQIILENFVHFLTLNKSQGRVYLESRGIIPDFELYQQYESIRQNGTLFIPNRTFQECLKAISFPLKIDNNIGVQLADFIPNPIARYFDGKEQRPHNILETIMQKSYDGANDFRERFGIKKVL